MWLVQFARNKKMFAFRFEHEDAAQRFYAWVQNLTNVEAGYCGLDN